MTSVAVISSAAASIKSLKDLHQNSGSWPNEADEILTDLEEMKKLLEAAPYNRRSEAVLLSYEIVDAIADSLNPPPPSSSSMIFNQLTRSRGTKLQKLHEQLKDCLDAGGGREKSPDDASLPSKKAGKPKANVGGIERKNSINSGPSTKEKIMNNFQRKAKKTNKPDSTTSSEVQEDNKAAAGSEPNPGSITGSETKGENVAVAQQTTKVSAADLFDLLKKELREPRKDLSREVSIVGENGMGKSTLARKLYNDPEIREHFSLFAWVSIDHNFQIKGVLQSLLKQLGPRQENQPDLTEMSEIRIISQIFDVINNKSYLLVLDGIWTVEDWESIRLALPLANSTRVIITTSSTNFLSRPHHHIVSGLTQPEILTLLEREASFDGVQDSKEVVKAIYELSGGSPLYATILGKSLKSEAKNEHLAKELRSYESKKGTPQVLEACYKRLAPQLCPCLLYLGQFPPGQDIQFEKLYLLLAAENLIQPKKKSLSDCLDDLASLKLVQVEKDILLQSGLYKSCRIHAQVREFCKFMGLDEEFFQVVEFDQSSEQVVGPNTRRLAIYMRNHGSGSSIKFGGSDAAKKILSLLFFDTLESAPEEKSGWPSEVKDLEDFPHLRILNFDGFNFRARKLPKGLGKLSHLRYLSFRGCILAELPPNLSKLTQLETLDLLVKDDCCVTIPSDDIFTRMKRMVHLYLPRQYESTGKGKLTLQGLVMLETLINFNTETFEVGDLYQLIKLKNLSTISNGENSKEMDGVINLLNQRKEELQHSSVEIRSFDCYDDACRSALENLLQCRFVNSVRIEGQIDQLPEEEDGGSGGSERVVSEMFLHGSELEDDPMVYLGRFQNLRRLVLADDAFIGTDITISSSLIMFPKLRSLKLRNLQYLEKLTIEEGALPQLSSLQIECCSDALEVNIPKELEHKLKNEIGCDAYSVVPSPSMQPRYYYRYPFDGNGSPDGSRPDACIIN